MAGKLRCMVGMLSVNQINSTGLYVVSIKAVDMWLVCRQYVVGVCLVCGQYVINMWSVWGQYVVSKGSR